ncbi:MAG: ATP-binding protein [Halioglobus sp.]
MKSTASKRMRLNRCAVLAAIMLASVYLTSYLMTHFAVAAATLMALPICLVAWRAGRWAGLWAGVLTGPFLYQFSVLMGAPTDIYVAYGFGPGLLVLGSLGFLMGYAVEQAQLARQAIRVVDLGRDLIQLVAADHPLQTTLDELITRVERELPGARCSLLLLEPESGTLRHVCAPRIPVAYREAIDGVAIGAGVGACGTAAYLNALVVSADIPNDPHWADFSELAREHNLAACWSLPVCDANGDVLGTFATYHDHPCYPEQQELDIVGEAAKNVQIAVERQRKNERQAALEEQVRTAQKLEGLGLLAGGIAHDFNNMMTIVRGNAELLSLDLTDSAQLKRSRAITKAATNAADLAMQLLVYAGMGTQQQEQVQLSHLVSELKSLVMAGLPTKIRLTLDLAADLPMVWADKSQMCQLVMNILNNAAQAIGDNNVGTVLLRTSTRTISANTLDHALQGARLAPGLYVCLEVEDDGEGITDELKKQIFDPYFTTKITGRGLGLAVVFGIVTHHNGAIAVDSEPGKYTRFTILLPACRHGTHAVVAGDDAAPLPVPSGAALIIDDDPLVREVTREYLRILGYQAVHEADGGREGVRLFSSLASSLALVMVDLTMPDMNGREVLKAMESRPNSARFILMTGYDVGEVGDNPVALAFQVLHKPFDLKSLAGAIAKS